MKKLAFVFAAIVAVSFASCGNKTEQGAAIDSDSVNVDSVCACADSCACDSDTTCCAQACEAVEAN